MKMDDDGKRDYLVHALSRTSRKDYENYVINAVWNRLGMRDVKPVTQQAVYWEDGHRSFIDLYFPQVRIGVECDEGYHQDPDQRARDARRELTIAEVIRQIRGGEYTPIHVDATLPFDEFEQAIDDAVARIAAAVDEEKTRGTFEPWERVEDDWRRYYEDKERISVADDIGFPTIADAVNTLCDDHKKSYQMTYFVPSGMRDEYDDRYRVWFPKLALGGKAVSAGWNNRLNQDGHIIEEFNEDDPSAVDPVTLEEAQRDQRITFAWSRDPMTHRYSYRFIGVFRRTTNNAEDTRKRYERVADSFPLIHR